MSAEAEDMVIHVRALHAITSSGRIDVLRCLRARRMHAGEIATRLGIAPSSAHKHLTRLADAGFLRRHEDSPPWVYYSLTPQGRHLVDQEKPRLRLLLATASAALLALVSLLGYRWYAYDRVYGSPWSGDHIHAPPSFFTTGVVLMVAFALLLVIAIAWLGARVVRAHGYEDVPVEHA